MKIWIDSDEAYPVYMFQVNGNRGGVEAEVPARQVKRWIQIQEDYDAVQAELQNLAGGRL